MPLSPLRLRPFRIGLHRGDSCAPSLAAAFLLLGIQGAPSGDLLRGGAAPSPGQRSAGPSAAAAQAADQARSQAKDALARTSRAVESVQRAQQSAARAAAGMNRARSNPNNPSLALPEVANGLGVGGLQVAPGAAGDLSVWTGAFQPEQRQVGGKTLVTVKQHSQQALLNWERFNVGRETELHFDQSEGGSAVGQWIAFNKVSDPSGRPTQILGSITAPGQVYVVNQNGIIFGGASQVNVHGLVASALPINDHLISRGLLNQSSTAQFLFSGLAQAGEVPFTPPAGPVGGRYGDVTVEEGAQLVAPTTASNVGGRIALVGANVNQRGSIATPDGQTILAAGLQVGFDGHSSQDASLRGLDTYVGSVGDYGGTVRQAGLIEAQRGSIALTGREIIQEGALESSTSVALNGRIDLRAEYNAGANQSYDPIGNATVPPFLYGGGPDGASTGKVLFGEGSVVRILPEWASAEKIPGQALALQSQLNVRGSLLHLGVGSLIQVPSGKVDLSTGLWDYAASGSSPTTSFVRAGGQIYVDRDAMINVAGTTDAEAALSQQILTVTLRSSELADAPLQRGTFLRGGDITVDLRKAGVYNGRAWVGTPLADLSGYLNLVERSVAELTVAGGSVSMNSGGSVVVQAGATIDASGGWVNYGGGAVRTTRLWREGRLVDIAEATPDRLYESIYTGEFQDVHARWGVTRGYRVPWMTGEHFEGGYLQGALAGRVALGGSAMALDGTLLGRSVRGPRQRAEVARGGILDVDFEIQQWEPGTGPDLLISPTPPQVVMGDERQAAVGGFGWDGAGQAGSLGDDRVGRVFLSPNLLEPTGGGFASLSVRNPDGDIVVPQGRRLAAPVGGSIRLEGANVLVEGEVSAPGGTLGFTAYNISPAVAARLLLSSGERPEASGERGIFTLGAEGVLDAAGQVVDQRRPDSGSFLDDLMVDGGSVKIRSYGADLAVGGRMAVSGGVLARAAGGLSYGKAGSIEVLTGQDPNLQAVVGGALRLGSTMEGYSGTSAGGSLSLQASLMQIGGRAEHALTVLLQPSFFNQGGFSTFSLTGLGALAPGGSGGDFLAAVSVADGVSWQPQVESWLGLPYGGAGGGLGLQAYVKPEGMRPPVQLSLTGKGVKDELGGGALVYRGDVRIGAGARLGTEAMGSIRLAGDTVAIYGELSAPAGTISVAGGSSYLTLGSPADYAQGTVYVGPGARLGARGAVVAQVDRFGRRRGVVLPGGRIAVSGNVIAEAGAVMDVSGSSGVFDLTPGEAGGGLVAFNSGVTGPLYQGLRVPTRLDSNGGSIVLRGDNMLFSDATLLGGAGGATAQGGSLAVSSRRFILPGSASNTAETNLVVSAAGPVILGGFAGSGIGQAVRDGGGAVVPGRGYVAADRLAQGGFSSLSLGGNVEFRGDVALAVDGTLRVATGGVIRADGAVHLKARYAALGQAFLAPQLPGTNTFLFTETLASGVTSEYHFSPSDGAGRLEVEADWMDVGTLSLQGIGETRLRVPGGDLRGNGTLQVAGRLELSAGQMYPTTGSAFNVVVYDGARGPGYLGVEGGVRRDLPLSAAGRLSLFAATLEQGGVLRAPLGSIQLGWDGTGEVPLVNPVAGVGAGLPVAQSLRLLAGSETSVAAVDPVTGRGLTIPYGMVQGGESWIAPSGLDITALGPPERRLQMGAKVLAAEAGSLIDVRGGGELLAYRWVPGTGGSMDVLASNGSFAILPGYEGEVAPYAPFNTGAEVFDGDGGYRNDSLAAGQRLHLSGSLGLGAGDYTLLPARYALLPGAWLVTPVTGSAVGAVALPDGSQLASGYQYVGGDPGVGASVQRRWELAPGSVVRQRSRYEEYLGSGFFAEAARALNVATPRLPVDAARLIFQASQGLSLNGKILARPLGEGRGAVVDISSPVDIFIGGAGASGPAGSLTLSASQLNAIGAESLLVGGLRRSTASGSAVAVNTGRLTLDNAGEALTGGDIILVARESLELAAGAQMEAREGAAEFLELGDGAVAGSGNGLLVRVSGAAGAGSSRVGVVPGGGALLKVGSGVRLSGGSLALDSTAGTALSEAAVLDARTVNLRSGQISVVGASPGALLGGQGLVLAGQALTSLEQNATNLNLLSYTSIDFYGRGAVSLPGSLSLSAGQLRGFNQNGGEMALRAGVVSLDNRAGAGVVGVVATAPGTLRLEGGRLELGAGNLRLDQFGAVEVQASEGLAVNGVGSLEVQHGLRGSLSAVVAERGANYGIRAGGALDLGALPGGVVPPSSLGGALVLEGASVRLGTDVILPSGSVTVRATSGDAVLSGRILAQGTRQELADLVRYTDAGKVVLEANAGSVRLEAGSLVDLSGESGGGRAGLLTISAPQGSLVAEGVLRGAGAEAAGSVVADVRALPQLSDLAGAFDGGGFFGERSLRVRTGDVLVDGASRARSFRLAADGGSISVRGSIDASGRTGGEIALVARDNVRLLGGARLSVAGEAFDAAGKGGVIRLEAGSQTGGVVATGAALELAGGALLDLSVAGRVEGSALVPGSSAFLGQFSGTLQLRAPQNAAGTDVQISPLAATIVGASAIVAEGYRLYDLTASGGAITAAVQGEIRSQGTAFGSQFGAVESRLLPGGASDPLARLLVVVPGAEVINRAGDVTLGTAGTTRTADWDLSGYRFGAKAAPGVLTLRASGNVVLNNSISDGFAGGTSLWLAPLMAQNAQLPVNAQSWSYRFTAGADGGAVAHGATVALSKLGAEQGSLILGKNYGNAAFVSGTNALTATALDNGNRLQVIRTGSGSIDLAAGRDIRLMNVFSTIYSAGTAVASAGSLFGANDFSLPVLEGTLNNVTTVLGRQQQNYPAQYAMGGGNVAMVAGHDVGRYTLSAAGSLIDDTARQIPGNWLYRRGYVDPVTGEYGVTGATQGGASIVDPAGSTTWWVDYSNFFQGVGALGGGNLRIAAGNDVRHVDAVVPTNARAARGRPDASRFLELGGGDLAVRAGSDIVGGTYYVERGSGVLEAGGAIALEATSVGSASAFSPRSPSQGIIAGLNNPTVTDAEAWIPTLLFLGRGGFDLQAGGDILLGSVGNTFLAPSGIGNKYWYKSYFSTYGEDSGVRVTSLNGDITHRLAVTLPDGLGPVPVLQAWIQTQNQFNTQFNVNGLSSNRQPWLRLAEADVGQLNTALSVLPPHWQSTALAGDIRIVGDLTLSPARAGSLELVAGGSVQGLNSSGLSDYIDNGRVTRVWSAATINLSDADPQAMASVLRPLAYHGVAELNATTQLPGALAAARGGMPLLTGLDAMFDESGSYAGRYAATQTKQSLHAAGVLHAEDRDPLRIYALGGDLSGLTLYSSKAGRLMSGRDITDVALYLQNVRDEDVSVVAAARDLLPYNPNSPQRSLVAAAGNLLARDQAPLVGDLQINGPGALELLAGRQLTLGSSPGLSDGTGDGISSIGNLRNPFLGATGADVVVAAGVGGATSLTDSALNLDEFIAQYVEGGDGAKYLAELGVSDFASKSAEERGRIALEVFYLVLRDAGRGYPATGNYDTGTAAVAVLFGGLTGAGDINLSSRSLKTRAGGDISVLVPGGKLSLGSNLGSGLVPPGIITEAGGNISVFAKGSIDVGVLRIFTLRGGNIMIWSSEGDVAAGSSSKTVAAAPPTRVVIDSQSADVATDLAGLSTGGGIGVLATVKNVKPGDVDLIAPLGAVDAGDAGIRSAGNLTIAASQVLNAGNIAVSGSSTGAPAVAAPAAPAAAAAPAPAPPSGAARPAGADAAAQAAASTAAAKAEAPLSEVEVTVIGYGGSEEVEEPAAGGEDEEEKRRRRAAGVVEEESAR